jgi:predicted phosphoribosyltransferase
MTAACALQTVRSRGARHVIIAAPVMSVESFDFLSNYADEVVALHVPAIFNSVGQHYFKL